LEKTLAEAQKQIEKVAATPEGGEQVHEDGVSEVGADRGYHSDRVLTKLEDQWIRAYIPEPKRKGRK
jgi:hypothetical protein